MPVISSSDTLDGPIEIEAEELLRTKVVNSHRFATFYNNTKPILTEIFKKGGDIAYIKSALSLVIADELCEQYKRKGFPILYPWNGRLRGIPHDSALLNIQKYDDGQLVDVDYFSAPKSLVQKLHEMEAHRLYIMGNPFSIEGKLITSYELETLYNGERYLLSCSHTAFLLDDTKSGIDIKPKKGPPGSLLSNVAMYIISRYLHRLGFKSINPTIADLLKGISTSLFCDDIDLNAEKVRRRIQWVKKQEALRNYALAWEEKWIEKVLTDSGL